MYRNVKNADNLLFLNHIAVMFILFEKDNKLFLNFFCKIVCLSKISLLILKPEKTWSMVEYRLKKLALIPANDVTFLAALCLSMV